MAVPLLHVTPLKSKLSISYKSMSFTIPEKKMAIKCQAAPADSGENDPVRYGILGCAEIARKVSRGMDFAPNAVLHAISSRSIEKAKQYAAEQGFSKDVKIYQSYNQVVDDPAVDVVYIPIPTSFHLKWAVEAANNKKHVLVEKPPALNAGDLDQIIKTCDANGVQYMDATMWMHHPRTDKMKEIISDKSVFGDIRLVHTVYTSPGDANFLENDIRCKPDLDGLGALGDSGWYCIRMSLWAVDYEMPKFVTSHPGAIYNKHGVVMQCGATLVWEDGKVSTFHCGFLSNLTMDVSILGASGTMRLEDFLVPYEEPSAKFNFSHKANWAPRWVGWGPQPNHYDVKTDMCQEARMVRELSRLVNNIKKGGKPEPQWGTISLKTQMIVDAVKRSLDNGCSTVEILEPIKVPVINGAPINSGLEAIPVPA